MGWYLMGCALCTREEAAIARYFLRCGCAFPVDGIRRKVVRRWARGKSSITFFPGKRFGSDRYAACDFLLSDLCATSLPVCGSHRTGCWVCADLPAPYPIAKIG